MWGGRNYSKPCKKTGQGPLGRRRQSELTRGAWDGCSCLAEGNPHVIFMQIVISFSNSRLFCWVLSSYSVPSLISQPILLFSCSCCLLPTNTVILFSFSIGSHHAFCFHLYSLHCPCFSYIFWVVPVLSSPFIPMFLSLLMFGSSTAHDCHLLCTKLRRHGNPFSPIESPKSPLVPGLNLNPNTLTCSIHGWFKYEVVKSCWRECRRSEHLPESQKKGHSICQVVTRIWT